MASRGVNKCIFIGNLGADPEMRYTASGKAVATFNIAINRSYTGGDGEPRQSTTWVSIVTWGNLAEVCNRYLTKGRPVYVEGRLQNRSWDGADGQKHYKTEIVASEVVFLGGGQNGGSEEEVDLEEEEEPLPLEEEDLPF